MCGGACDGTNLAPLLTEDLKWLWKQIADAADRRGDPALTTGTLVVDLPAEPAARAAALGLISDRPLTSHRKSVDLGNLAFRLQRRSPHLTPGAVAAHQRGAPLATRARQTAARQAQEAQLVPAVTALTTQSPILGQPEPLALWDGLRRTGWITRLLRQDSPLTLVNQARQVLAELPAEGQRRDRRRIAEAVTGDPHALDDGTALAGLTLAVLTTAGVIPAAARTRAAWSVVGVDLDDLTGGLLTLGLRPRGWNLPDASVITLPPRELAGVTWAAPPQPGSIVHITENPSVIAAASDLARSGTRCFVVCTSGTPAATGVEALASLPGLGWQVLVRADFDVAGIEHVRALLNGIPGARPWRMDAAEYRAYAADRSSPVPLRACVGATPWDPALAAAMREMGVAIYEETLLPKLLGDLADASRHSA